MMNVKETLKKLHKKFPLMSLDELFEILDCYTDEVYDWLHYKPTSQIWTTSNNGNITATLNDVTRMYDNGAITTIKNYANSADVQLNGHN